MLCCARGVALPLRDVHACQRAVHADAIDPTAGQRPEPSGPTCSRPVDAKVADRGWTGTLRPTEADGVGLHARRICPALRGLADNWGHGSLEAVVAAPGDLTVSALDRPFRLGCRSQDGCCRTTRCDLAPKLAPSVGAREGRAVITQVEAKSPLRGTQQGRTALSGQTSIISRIRWARSAMTNGLVMTSIPGSRWPFPTAAFSAKPVTNRTLSLGLVTRAASAT